MPAFYTRKTISDRQISVVITRLNPPGNPATAETEGACDSPIAFENHEFTDGSLPLEEIASRPRFLSIVERLCKFDIQEVTSTDDTVAETITWSARFRNSGLVFGEQWTYSQMDRLMNLTQSLSQLSDSAST